ncbi:Uncharacterized protein Rs2_41043 [Raphanus sativus]|nr:Uncharacterized protein Rs2_41043 [Raphanus sativus]
MFNQANTLLGHDWTREVETGVMKPGVEVKTGVVETGVMRPGAKIRTRLVETGMTRPGVKIRTGVVETGMTRPGVWARPELLDGDQGPGAIKDPGVWAKTGLGRVTRACRLRPECLDREEEVGRGGSLGKRLLDRLIQGAL